MSEASPARNPVRCREITPADLEQVHLLLTKGFPERSPSFWMRALNRLSERTEPTGYPKYGYLLECNAAAVGVYLQIHSSHLVNGETKIRCSTSSLFVEPAFQMYASMLISRAERRREVTYFYITAGPRSAEIAEAREYHRYCDGQFAAVPALSARAAPGIRLRLAQCDREATEELPAYERDLLLAHAGYGCISVVGSFEGRRYPFVFLPLWGDAVPHLDRLSWRRPRDIGHLVLRLLRYAVPHTHLVYCRGIEDFVRFARPLGLFLARRSYPVVIIDSSGPIDGLVGTYVGGGPKYFKGPDRPRLGDIAYSERAIFGF